MLFLAHCSPATQASVLFLKHLSTLSASDHLFAVHHFHSLLPGTLFPSSLNSLLPSYRQMSLHQRGLYKVVVTPFTLLCSLITLYFLHYTYHHLINCQFLICLVSVSTMVTNCRGLWGFWDVCSAFSTKAGQSQANWIEGPPCFFTGMEASWENGICVFTAVS